MKKFTFSEFQEMLGQTLTKWVHEQDVEFFDPNEIPVYDAEGDISHTVQESCGCVNITSILDGMEIIYTEGFSFQDNEPDTLTTSTDQPTVWSISGFIVVDDYGDTIEAHTLADYLPSYFSETDYSEITIKETDDIDFDQDSNMETFTLEISNAPDIRFSGELIATVSSSPNNAAGSSYSGETGRWTVLALYKTKGGKYVCHQIGYSSWVNERTRYSGRVCETVEEVIEFFGHRWLAKDLYEEAKIEDVNNID